ncbi:MAG: FecR family protein, partial [Patescibacteria group bacterium]
MKKLLFLVILIVIGIGFFVFNKKPALAPAPTFKEKSRVEVITSGVSVVGSDGISRNVLSGDEISVPATLTTDSTGKASIYLPDGSVARLDSSSSLIVDEASYDSKSGTLRVSLVLTLGRVWSKIIDLATPESRWKVETSYAIATVRGTAFGMGTDAKSSWVVGSSHVVGVAPKDPKTKKVLSEKEIALDENKAVYIDSAELSKKVNTFELKKVEPALILNSSDWIEDNKPKDKEIDLLIEKNKGQSQEILREQLIQKVFEKIGPIREEGELREEVQEERVSEQKTDESVEVKKEVEAVKVQEVLRPKVEVKIAPPAKAIIEGPTSLEVVPSQDLSRVLEGAQILFKAIAKFRDGTTKDVTDKVVWNVLGPIGTIKAGSFRAALSDQVSEYGEAPGAITAVFLSPEKELLGKTPV